MDDSGLCHPADVQRYQRLQVCNLAVEMCNMEFIQVDVVRKKAVLVKLFSSTHVRTYNANT